MHIQALVSADGILPGSSSKLRLLVINLASVPGGQLVNSPTAQSLERCMQAPTAVSKILKTEFADPTSFGFLNIHFDKF